MPESVQWYGERFLQLPNSNGSDDQERPPKLLKELPFFDVLKKLLDGQKHTYSIMPNHDLITIYVCFEEAMAAVNFHSMVYRGD